MFIEKKSKILKDSTQRRVQVRAFDGCDKMKLMVGFPSFNLFNPLLVPCCHLKSLLYNSFKETLMA